MCPYTAMLIPSLSVWTCKCFVTQLTFTPIWAFIFDPFMEQSGHFFFLQLACAFTAFYWNYYQHSSNLVSWSSKQVFRFLILNHNRDELVDTDGLSSQNHHVVFLLAYGQIVSSVIVHKQFGPLLRSKKRPWLPC